MPLSEIAMRNRRIKRVLVRVWGRDRHIRVLCGATKRRGSDAEYNFVRVVTDHPDLANPAKAERLRKAALDAIQRAGLQLQPECITFSFAMTDTPDRMTASGVVTWKF
jgi:hypothetical protein